MTGGRKGKGQAISFSLLLLSFLLLAGCKHRKHADTADEVKKKKDDKPPVSSIATQSGHTLVYQSSDPRSPPSFSLRWTQGLFDATQGPAAKDHLVLPAGEIYQDAKPSSTYRADTGDSLRAIKRLDMDGNVVLRSIDKTQTLKAPKGQYRGDARILRAMGGVTATGPFGTLTGMPEAWATPDLKIIGSPDMVVQKLKLSSLASLAAAVAVGSPVLQKSNEYNIGKTGGQFYDRTDPLHPKATFRPPKEGPLVVTLPSRGLVFHFTKTVNMEFVPNTNKVRHMTSEGPVNVVQTTPAGTNTLDGTGSVYDAPVNAETGTLDVGGRVTLVSEGKDKADARTVTTAKGDQGHAIILQQAPAGTDGLKSATLTGNVVVDSLGADGGTFNGTGDKGVYTPHGDTADVDMTGHAVMTSVTKGKDTDAQGNPVTNRTVGHGQTGHGIVDAKTAAGVSPLRSAVLDRDVSVDVSGSNGQNFKGTHGERLVYTREGEGGRAVMTGPAMVFTGDLPEGFGNTEGSNIATITIGKSGWETVDLNNTNDTGTATTILPKPGTKPPKPVPTLKKGKKGGKP